MIGKVLLIGAEDEENLAIRYLGSVLQKESYNVKITPCSSKEEFKKVLKEIKNFKPDLVAISLAFQQLATTYFDLINKIRIEGYKGHITVGGHFATFEFEKILRTQKGIDTVIRFEGELPLIKLINAILKHKEFKSIPNLVYRENNKIIQNEQILRFPNLDELPYPIRSKNPQNRIGEKFATLISSRGCWHSNCLYCCIGAFHSKKTGSKCTFRSVKSVAKEISSLYHNKGVRLFQFHDDNFMMPSKEASVKRFKELRDELVRLDMSIDNIAFVIKARPDSINDEVAEELSKLGVVGTFLGVENASSSGLKAMIRGNSLESIYNALNSFKKYGIVVTYNLLIFHPTATMQEINENIKFIEEHSYLSFDVARAEIVAGSPLERLVNNKKTKIGNWPNWGYILDDPIVDRMFEIYLKSFRKKGSLCQSLAQESIMLAYQVNVVRRLHKGPINNDLSNQALRLVKKSSVFIAEKLKKMRELAIKNYSETELINFNKELYSGCQELLNDIRIITTQLKKIQFIENQFDKFGIRDIVQKNKIITTIFNI